VGNDEHEKVVSRIALPTSEPSGLPKDARDAAQPRPDTALHLAVPADWISPSVVRSHLRSWLGDLRWPPRRIDELVLAVSEMVSNSIEHGYGRAVDHPTPAHDQVEVEGRITVDDAGSRAVVTVTDHGTWRIPDTGPSSRGRGTLLARACTDELTTRHGPEGTVVVMRSRPVSLPPAG
jgi:anti-sigma regulatory factor (Ser/Thr protein kinase)